MGQKIQPGDRSIPSAEFNRHVDVADIVLGTQQLGQPGRRTPWQSYGDRVTVKNASGAARRRGEILEITGCPFANFDSRQLWLTGDEPAAAGGFGVLLEPVADGKFAHNGLQLSGVCFALVNITDTDHRFARVVAGEYVLQSGNTGEARILQAESTGIGDPGTGEKTCIVQLGVVSHEFVRLLQSPTSIPKPFAYVTWGIQVGEGFSLANGNVDIVVEKAGRYAFGLSFTATPTGDVGNTDHGLGIVIVNSTSVPDALAYRSAGPAPADQTDSTNLATGGVADMEAGGYFQVWNPYSGIDLLQEARFWAHRIGH